LWILLQYNLNLRRKKQRIELRRKKQRIELKSHIALLQEVCTTRPYLVRVALAIPHQDDKMSWLNLLIQKSRISTGGTILPCYAAVRFDTALLNEKLLTFFFAASFLQRLNPNWTNLNWTDFVRRADYNGNMLSYVPWVCPIFLATHYHLFEVQCHNTSWP